jgi:hypothetical protein
MLEIDGVRSALSFANAAEIDRHSDSYLASIDRATDPKLPRSRRIFRELWNYRQLMDSGAQWALRELEDVERNDPEHFAGVTDAYLNSVGQVDEIIVKALEEISE